MSLVSSASCSDARCATSRRTGVSAAFFIEQEFQLTGAFVLSIESVHGYEAFVSFTTTFRLGIAVSQCPGNHFNGFTTQALDSVQHRKPSKWFLALFGSLIPNLKVGVNET